MVDLRIELPEGYLDEEIRDGFTVTTQRKKVWAVQLDLLMEAYRVCNKYGITLLADSGTMLGAVRHKGFIPWDDDIDLTVSRSDYKKLCAVSKEFKHPYFFQTEETDPGSGRGHAQLRNSETTAILNNEKETGYTFNQGIFIDIFPYDTVPDDRSECIELINKIEKNRNRSISYAKLFYSKNPGTGYRWFFAHALQIAIKLFHVRYNNIYYKEMEKDKLTYSGTESHYIANLYRIENNNPEKLIWKKEWYEDTVEVPFEFVSIKLPAGYIEYMEMTYGDWKKFVIGGTVHEDILFDTDRSYREYL